MEDNKLTEIYTRLRLDLSFYAKNCLTISDKGGREVPFILNKAQTYLHNRIEEQLRRTGRVRILIVKGRQQGCSTYTAARFYHKAVFNKGQAVYILSHESNTTQKLFNIVKRYHENVPPPIRAEVMEDNMKSFKFKNGSSYTVGTARNKNTGRGGTIQLFHGSEVAFYENTDELQTGLLQSIADLPGTEIILESTANGLGNFFHQACMNALKGEGPYELVFIPWYWQDEYYIKPPSHFHPSEDEKQLMSDYGLSEGQIYWRRQKILAFGAGGEWKFQQEYPLTVHEAFVSSGESMIPPEKIFQARKRSIGIDTENPMILGIDTSRTKDRFVIVPRRGRRMYEPEVYSPKEVGEITTDVGARYVLDAMERYHPDKCFIDVTKDYGVYDWLVNHGYSRLITPVVFSEGALRKELYLNKRAEMLIAVRDWFDAFEVQIPDRDDVQSDISAIPLPKQSAVGKWFIESKENIKQKYGLSTDIMDALALTFAFPVRYNKDNEFGGQILHKKVLTKKNSGSCLTTYQRASKSNRYGKSQLR